MSVQVNTDNNSVTVQNTHQTITVVDSGNANVINVEQPLVNIIRVATPGPQGAQGPSVTGGVAAYVPLWTSSQNLSTSSLYQVTTKQVILGATASVHPGNEEAFAVYQGVGTSYNLISGHSNIDSYTQLNIKNFSGGENASSDIVATRNDGNENTGYIDMGINSSGYTNTALVGTAGDAYLYSTGENLYIGNATPSKQVVIFNGGLDATANARVYIHDQGTVSINTDEIGPDPTNPPALFVHPTAVGASNFNMIVAEADVNNYSQIALINKNAGSFASADIVAQNDIGTETDHYVDMGINSSTRAPDSSFTVGEANDTYLLSVSTGGSHYIGSPKNSDIYIFTGDNFNGKAHAKAVFKANNQHQISGSLNISGSITINSGSALSINDRFYVNGNKQFNYGAFSSTQTQIGLRNSILSMSFNTTDIGGAGVSLVDNTKLRVENTGIYNLQFSTQLDRSTSGTNIVTIWFAYTGSSVANSATDVTITGGAAANPLVAAWNYILPMSASSYVEIYWSHNDNADDDIELKAVPTRSNPTRPAVPSVIATLTQIA